MYQAPRGTTDILPEMQPYWSYVRSTMARVAHASGYRRIDTPVFEQTGLFLRTVGEETDIVQKEIYSFRDRGDTDLALRPEGTAAVCRAYLEHGMSNQPQPVRLFYDCPMFRYDRPQAGRYRQFHQIGAEAIGEADPAIDVEIIQLALTVLKSVGLSELMLIINSIGDTAERPQYLQALRDYYLPNLPYLCKDCQQRYVKNPLRLLDCKQASCQPFFAGAPRSIDNLGAAAREHWEKLLGYLDALNIAYRIDHRLVRGLDYYTRTVFEIQPMAEGAQSTICAGGRYDGLMEQLGGKATPGIGFAAGIERIILNLQREEVKPPEAALPSAVLAYRGEQAKLRSLQLAATLRNRGVSAVLSPDRSLKAQMRYATSINATHVLILGDTEMAKGTVTIKEMGSGEQREVPVAAVAESIR